MALFKDLTPPQGGRIEISGGALRVPDDPIVPYVEGDGTGRDIWRASQRVFDAAVREGLRRQAHDRLDGGAGRREGLQPDDGVDARRRRSTPSASTWSASRARSPRRSAAASAR